MTQIDNKMTQLENLKQPVRTIFTRKENGTRL